ncbi:hypothetical protein HanLR1_Chr12g0446641 [Helianthus annuus]|nr:hypothetical protein HanHA89_Chr12g0469651 [Helianthus annuus]KAJ0675033.1 hypothetical protein HanLR1_Chr12g0446641 [Helianthus annuus]
MTCGCMSIVKEEEQTVCVARKNHRQLYFFTIYPGPLDLKLNHPIVSLYRHVLSHQVWLFKNLNRLALVGFGS